MQPSSPSSFRDDGLGALARALAPQAVSVRYVGGAAPFELEWHGPHGAVRVRGESADAAAHEALRCLLRSPANDGAPTEPDGDTSYAEAMRELIEGMTPQRRHLRLVR